MLIVLVLIAFSRSNTVSHADITTNYLAESPASPQIKVIGCAPDKNRSTPGHQDDTMMMAHVKKQFFTTPPGTEEIFIKWPNDIYIRDRKAGGILIENVIQGNIWKYAVAGIGININQTEFNKEANNPTSLKKITGKNFDTVELAKTLYENVLLRVNDLQIKCFADLLKQYNSNLYKLNIVVKLKKETVFFETMIKGVNERGKLLTTDIIDNEFDFGEVEWIASPLTPRQKTGE